MRLKPILIGIFVIGFILALSIMLIPGTVESETMGDCISECKADCLLAYPYQYQKADRKLCKDKCHAARCELLGTIESAANTGESGIICDGEEDGECNPFCPEDLDLDCGECQYLTKVCCGSSPSPEICHTPPCYEGLWLDGCLCLDYRKAHLCLDDECCICCEENCDLTGKNPGEWIENYCDFQNVDCDECLGN